jgi:predicted 3-demethylubiquinone-9 3-methyltransferase (glyoxalase superfamily)
MSKVTPYFWYDHHAEEAANFYVSLIPNSRVVSVKHWPDGSPFGKGAAQSVIFELDGRRFMAMDAGPQFKFSEALSMFVDCKDQKEVDYLWDKLTENGGEESMCGWLKDRFGLSWQIIPAGLPAALGHKDPIKAGKATQAMLQMRKIDMAEIERAMNA